MTTKEKWNRRFRVAQQNWISAIALTGLVAVAVLWLLPATRDHPGFFIAICCYAVAMMVLDLRVSLAKPPATRRYSSLHDAAADVGEAIRKALKRRRKDVLNIRIISGRMNTVGVMLNSLAGEIRDGSLSCHKANIVVLCVDPDYLRQLQLPNVKDPTPFREHTMTYVESIEANSRTLVAYNNWDKFKTQGIHLDVYYYSSLPVCYAILIGDKAIYWGYYTWDDERNDFDGPTNPCFCVDPSQEEFSDLHEWLTNRSGFLMASGRRFSVRPEVHASEPSLAKEADKG